MRVLANVVLAALGGAERIDKDAAYAAGTLLNNLRGSPVPIAEAELCLLGMFGAFRRTQLV